MKKVSIIVPCYNSAKYIQVCMDSLFAQTIGMDMMEIILVDDCSKDDTLQALLGYEKEWPESIMVIPLSENMMQGGARNVALQYASGEYTLYLDSDDWIVPTALEKLYFAAVEQQADVVEFLNRDVFSKDEEIADTKSNMENELFVIDTEEKRKQYIIGYRDESTLGCWNKFYKTKLIQELHLTYAEHVAYQEPPFTFPLRFYETRHYFLNEYLHYCKQNPEGTVRCITMREEHKCDHLFAQYYLLNQLIERGLLEQYHDEIEWYFVHTYFFGSLLFMVGRMLMPEALLVQEMQRTVKYHFPNYAENPYLQANSLDQELIPFIEVQVDERNIEEYNSQWRAIALELYG